MEKIIFRPEFEKDLKRYSNIRKAVRKKIDNLLEAPMGFGEPLKGDLLGFSSCPVKKSFIIIYVYCKECRLRYQEILKCPDCDKTPDETVIFLTFGPHDAAY